MSDGSSDSSTGQQPLTRKRLYEIVWSESMVQAAKRFGITDVGLAKICRSNDIPLPPQGYWSRNASNRGGPQLPLPNPDSDTRIVIRGVSHRPKKPALPDDIAEVIAAVRRKQSPVVVRDNLRGAHPLVTSANDELRSARCGPERIIIVPDSPSLQLAVSKNSLRRALLVMDAVLRAICRCADAICPGPRIAMLGTEVVLRMTEVMERKPVDDDESFSISEGYDFHHRRRDRVPSGRLTLQVRDGQNRFYDQQVWRDTPTKPLESQMEILIDGLFAFVGRELQSHKREEQQAVQREQSRLSLLEAERRRAERAKVVAVEYQRFEKLLDESKRWHRSQRLRAYIAAKKEQYLAIHAEIEPDSEFGQWLRWAMSCADWLDPLAASPPSLLDERVEGIQPSPRRIY